MQNTKRVDPCNFLQLTMNLINTDALQQVYIYIYISVYIDLNGSSSINLVQVAPFMKLAEVRALGNLTSLGGQTSWTVHAVAGSSRTAGRCKFLDNQRWFAKLK